MISKKNNAIERPAVGTMRANMRHYHDSAPLNQLPNDGQAKRETERVQLDVTVQHCC